MNVETDLTLPGLIHDLNNVFQTLVDAADLLSADPQWAHVSAALLRSVERGKHIAATIQSGAQAADSLADDNTAIASQIIANAIAFVQDTQIAGRGPLVHFDCDVDSDIELRDPWAWERVLINLFLNAMHAMPDGGSIQVCARRVEDCVEISVRDQGLGIPGHILETLFEPRVSARASSGLGLHIVQTIVNQDGGQVRASNLPEGGAEFVITLPEPAVPRRAGLAHV